MTSVPQSAGRWRSPPGARDETTARKRAFLFAFVASLVLHLPLLPSRLLLFFDWLNRATTPVELADLDGEVVIPIDFDLDPHATEAPAAAPPPEPMPAPVAPPQTPPTPPAPKGPDPATVDAGAPDGGPEVADAAADADAPKPVASAAPDAGAPPATPSLKQPMDQAGGPGRLAKDPNVQVLIASDRIRKHELGAAFGRLLTTIPEWKSFFEGTGIDPIRDLDHLLIAGPQLRDSSKAVAILDYNLTDARVRQAIEVVVARSDPKGEWIEDAPVPTARATADEGERLFAFVPGKRLLAVLPGDAEDQLGKLKQTKGFNKSSNAGIVISLSSPGRAFKGLPIDVPDELKWLRVSVVPRADGGADVALELLDASDELATKHAAELEASLEKLRKPDLGMLSSFAKIELFQPVHFTAAGSIIRAKTSVDEHQLRRIMTHAEEQLKKQRPSKKSKTKKKANKDKPAEQGAADPATQKDPATKPDKSVEGPRADPDKGNNPYE